MSARILICDNEEPLRALVRASLNDEYEIHEARDGDEALELSRSLRPDLIVLDMMMPGRTGLEVLRALADDDGVRRPRVIMLTARAQAADVEAAEAAGAELFLSKPFSPRVLAESVHALLAR